VLVPVCKKRLAVEAGVSFGWQRYIGCQGATISLNTFGASAPFKDLTRRFGFTVENVVARARDLLAGSASVSLPKN
jgi:transketolase